jgi:hypothetical protein
MKSVPSLTLIICLLARMIPVGAHELNPIDRTGAPEGTRVTAQNAESRFADARRVTPMGGGRVEEAKGLLVMDPQAKEIRFEVGAQPAFAVPYDRITAMHYEKAVDPSKWGWPLKDTRCYLIIHYADPAGRAAFETVRFSERDVPSVLDALETAAGLKVDHTLARRSFLGIPIRAAIGDWVRVTDQAGQNTEGNITELSASSLTLEGSTVFDGVSVKKITRTRSPGRDALRGFGSGAVIGGIAGGLMARALGGDARSTFQVAAIYGAFLGGVGALVSGATASYRFRATRDIYLGGTPGASKTSAIRIVPRLATDDRGLGL